MTRESRDRRLDTYGCLVPQQQVLLVISLLFILYDNCSELLPLPALIGRVHCTTELGNELIIKSLLPLLFVFVQEKHILLVFDLRTLLVVVTNSVTA